MINPPPSCSPRTRNNTSRQVLHSQSVEAFMTSICRWMDFIVRSLERLRRLAVEKQHAGFSAQQVHRVRGARALFSTRETAPASLHQCVHPPESLYQFCAKGHGSVEPGYGLRRFLSEVQIHPGSCNCEGSGAPQFASVGHIWVQTATSWPSLFYWNRTATPHPSQTND